MSLFRAEPQVGDPHDGKPRNRSRKAAKGPPAPCMPPSREDGGSRGASNGSPPLCSASEDKSGGRARAVRGGEGAGRGVGEVRVRGRTCCRGRVRGPSACGRLFFNGTLLAVKVPPVAVEHDEEKEKKQSGMSEGLVLTDGGPPVAEAVESMQAPQVQRVKKKCRDAPTRPEGERRSSRETRGQY